MTSAVCACVPPEDVPPCGDDDRSSVRGRRAAAVSLRVPALTNDFERSSYAFEHVIEDSIGNRAGIDSDAGLRPTNAGQSGRKSCKCNAKDRQPGRDAGGGQRIIIRSTGLDGCLRASEGTM